MTRASPTASPVRGDAAAPLQRLFDDLLLRYGPQHWWPGDSALEISVGAILVQRTTWHNAAAAIANLQRRGLLRADALCELPSTRLEECLRPAGFYRAKTRCLRGFCDWLMAAGGFDALKVRPTDDIRADLTVLKGIGPETADCILLYALGRPVFVIDAYSRRILARTGLRPDAERLSYETLRGWVEGRLAPDPALYSEYHALLVAHGKTVCRPRPLCETCAIVSRCRYVRGG